jgi:hypothetical protein
MSFKFIDNSNPYLINELHLPTWLSFNFIDQSQLINWLVAGADYFTGISARSLVTPVGWAGAHGQPYTKRQLRIEAQS